MNEDSSPPILSTSTSDAMDGAEGFGRTYWRRAGTSCDTFRDLTPSEMDHAEFKGLADNLPTLCWIANADGYIIWYNRRWYDYTGKTSIEMEGWGWQSVHDSSVLPDVLAHWTRAIATGEPFEMVFPLKGADGAFRPFLTRIVPLKDANGVVCRWIGNNVDISQQRGVEDDLRVSKAQLHQLNQTLEQRVEERTAQNTVISEQLRQSQKLEAIGQLTGGVAHDFNNLLTVIRGSVDLLKRNNLSAEKRDRYIDAIGSTADRAAKLTRQLLAFARRQALTPTLFDAGESLREVAEMISTLTGSRIVLDTYVPEDTFFIIADRSQFDTAIVNMGINARDAMQGEGTLTMATGPVSGIPAIRAHPPVLGDFVAVTITDTGMGIPQSEISAIFEPFYTTKSVGQGTGLGLSQVIGFAKQSGGDIRVESVPGEGTTFTLYLPRAYPDAAAPELEVAEEANLGGEGFCVLVVEDNEDVGRFATHALKELGYDSVLAANADQALAELSHDRSRFHIVFSDVVMPGKSGLELGGDVRRLYPDIPVVLTSGYSHVLAHNGKHGFELLHKPYSVEQLSRVLHKAIRWQERQRGKA